MLKTGLIIGIYSYIILFFGIIGKITFVPVIITTLIFFIVIPIIFYQDVIRLLSCIKRLRKIELVFLIPLIILILIRVVTKELYFI